MLIGPETTITFPGCPLAGYLVNQVEDRVRQVAEGRQVDVEIQDEPWRPPWAARPRED